MTTRFVTRAARAADGRTLAEVTCEGTLEPPKPRSLTSHQRRGLPPVGPATGQRAVTVSSARA